MTDSATYAAMAAQAAQVGGDEALTGFRTPLTIEAKTNKNDVVTEVDRAVQETVIDHIRADFPDDPIVAEENERSTTVPETGPAWTIDPIDGTANYVRGLPIWSTSVGVLRAGEPIGGATVLPALGDVYVADGEQARLNGERSGVSSRTDIEKFVLAVLGSGAVPDRNDYAALSSTVVERFGDLRRLGCTTAALAFVATGELDAAITATPKSPWDLIAGIHLVECAGGTVTTVDGHPWTPGNERVVASNGLAHERVLQIARDAIR